MNHLKSLGKLSALVLFVLMFSLALMQACQNNKPAQTKSSNAVTPKTTPKTTSKPASTTTQPTTNKADASKDMPSPRGTEGDKKKQTAPTKKFKPPAIMPATKSGAFLKPPKTSPKLLPTTKKGPFLNIKKGTGGPGSKHSPPAPNQINAPLKTK